MNPLDPFQCSSLQINMATLRGCSCCVNQGVGGFTLPGVLCCKLFTHHCPATSHSHCPTTSHSHCPTTSRSHCPATSHSNCPISLLDTVLARQPYCSCPPRGQCALFRNWALSPGVVHNLKVGCMTRRLRKFWKCTVICRFLEHTCTLYMYDASTLYCYCHAPRVTKPPLWHDWPRYAYPMDVSACSDMAYAVHKCNLIAFLLTFWSIVGRVCLEFFWWACLWGYCFWFVASCKHRYCACIHTL